MKCKDCQKIAGKFEELMKKNGYQSFSKELRAEEIYGADKI